MESTESIQQDMSYGDPLAVIAMDASVVPSLSPVHTEPTDVKALLKRQVEYYFSRENLNHDTYLVSQMDADQYVDISIILSFNQVKRLTSDRNLLVEVLKESVNVQVDDTEQKVRPLHKRTVVILREIPENTTQKEIEDIFTHSSCPSFVSCEYASGNCWYVHFETEEQAQDAFRYIRETLGTFKGQRIMARIKAKPTATVSVAAVSRTDQQMPMVHTADATRTHVAPPPPTTAIRYPVALPHLPLQSPFSFPPPGPYAYQYPYVLPQPFIAPAPWNPQFIEQAQYGQYDLGYPYQQLPSHQQLRSAIPNSGRTQGERRNHSRGSSNTSERGDSVPMVTQSVAATTTTTKNSTISHSGYYNGHNSRSHIESSNYQKHNGGEKMPNSRGRSNYMGGQSMHDHHHYNNADNIPPRHRDAAQSGYRSHKRVSSAAHTNQLAQAPPTQSQIPNGPPPPRRSINHSRGSMTNSSNTGAGHVPHHQRALPPPSSSTHDNRGDRSNREYNSRQSNAETQPAHARPHGAHRGSKSPDKDIEQQQANEVIKSKSFELDSSAFPALPGATTAASPPTANTISPQPHSDSVAAASSAGGAATQVTPVTNESSKPSSSVSGEATDKITGGVDSVAKLSDIVKSNLPDTGVAKLSDIVKGVNLNKQSTSTQQAASHNKDIAEKPTQAAAVRNHGANKAHNGPSHQRVRPSHLTNGAPPTETTNKNSSKHVKSSPSSTAKSPADGLPGSGKPSLPLDAAASTAKSNKSDLTIDQIESKSTQGPQLSPTDHKVSYAAMAQRVASANQPVTPKTSPNQDQAPTSPTATPSSSGDNNNNADSKSSAASKSDNLYSSTATKSTSNTAAVISNGPSRKPPQTPQYPRNGPSKQKGTTRPPTSPPTRNPPSTHAPSSAVIAR